MEQIRAVIVQPSVAGWLVLQRVAAPSPQPSEALVRSVGERYDNIQHWTPMLRGGHFAALEEPEMLAADLRACFRDLRS
jgi:hypothetical protein